MYPSIENFVGNTPLVRLKRIPGDTNNVLLAKLEGNNPAGSVKDRPALSMIARAEQRGDIKPGDTLIEATSGNTGIALAMAAAMRGYKMILVMPENQSMERRQTMRAFGAELVLTAKEGSMELARDTAEELRDQGSGILLDQFANPDKSAGTLRRHRVGDLARYQRQNHPLHQLHGHDRHHHGLRALLQGTKSQCPGHRRATGRRCADPRHTQMAAGLFAQDL